MGRAVWCDTNAEGHPLNERDAIMVTGRESAFFFCGPHNFDALKKALIIASEEGTCRFLFPPAGGFTIHSDTTQPATPPGAAPQPRPPQAPPPPRRA